MAVCGVLSGANSIAGIHEFAIDRRRWFARYLDLTHGVPSEDTFGRVLARIDPAALEKCLLSWIRAVQELTENRVVAIDGKTLRGSCDHERDRPAIYMVSAWAAANKLSLGQVVVSEKSNEITAIPQLLELLDIAGALVPIDAMGCQREIADRIREGGGDYVLAVKQNQLKLHERVEEAISGALEEDAEYLDQHQTGEKGHGRQETRTYAIVAAPESVDPEKLRRDLSAVGIAISERVDSQGHQIMESRYYILQPSDNSAGVWGSGPRPLGH
jgi:predicted transposase YbfD/YdcC